MKIVKDYMMKLGFVFKEIFKAGPSVFFLSVSSMVIAGISPVLITYLTAELIERLGQNIGNDSQDVYVRVIGAFVVMFLLVIISYATESVKTVICAVAGLKLSHNIENIVADKFQNIKQERIDNPDFLDLHSNTLNRCGSEPLNLMESLFGTVANAISLGKEKAELFATAHEDKDVTGNESDGYSKSAHKEMDLHNNEIGRNIGQNNLNTSEDEMANIIYEAIHTENSEFIWLHD